VRTLVVAIVALLAACGGGEGRCESPPCEVPQHPCSADADCFQTQFCDFENNTCGASGDEGFCSARPSGDACQFEPRDLACGCDGVYHASSCLAARDGTDLAITGGCPLPAGAFECGSRACLRDEQVCIELPRDAINSDFACESFPQECGSKPSCTCFLSFGCDECIEENGGFRVRCFLPDPTAEDV
jgi:hypothetical protein